MFCGLGNLEGGREVLTVLISRTHVPRGCANIDIIIVETFGLQHEARKETTSPTSNIRRIAKTQTRQICQKQEQKKLQKKRKKAKNKQAHAPSGRGRKRSVRRWRTSSQGPRTPPSWPAPSSLGSCAPVVHRTQKNNKKNKQRASVTCNCETFHSNSLLGAARISMSTPPNGGGDGGVGTSREAGAGRGVVMVFRS